MTRNFENGTRLIIEHLCSMMVRDFERFIDQTSPETTADEAEAYFRPHVIVKWNPHCVFNWEIIAEYMRMLHE